MNTETLPNCTPAEAWAIYVGDDDPLEYTTADVLHYVRYAPLCAGLCHADRVALARLLLLHRDNAYCCE